MLFSLSRYTAHSARRRHKGTSLLLTVYSMTYVFRGFFVSAIVFYIPQR
jgi:hypothetical protein